MRDYKYKVILPCAGSGQRFGGDIPKQYVKLHGRYLIEHTLDAVLNVLAIDQVYIVVNKEDNFIEQVIQQYQHQYKHRIKILPVGGDSRAMTVLNALNEINQNTEYFDWILVHDIVRCYIKSELIERLIKKLRYEEVGGILAIPSRDTVKLVDSNGLIIKTLERKNIYLAQTPQMFRHGVLLAAYKNIDDLSKMTDESSIIERYGKEVLIVSGDESNIKITYNIDIK
jgi:2-C-methyl-D-erythritol 4-phosphate cytidylyltransferase